MVIIKLRMVQRLMETDILSSPESTTIEAITPDQLLEIFAEFLKIDVAAGDASQDTIRTYLSQIQQR